MCSSFISVNNFYRNDGSNEKQTVKQKLKHEKKFHTMPLRPLMCNNILYLKYVNKSARNGDIKR